jgi:hypothetical protein
LSPVAVSARIERSAGPRKGLTYMNSKDTPIARVTALVERAITDEMGRHAKEKFWVTHYGANNIHPKHLVYWIVVGSDYEKHRLEADSGLMAVLRSLLMKYDYPIEGRDGVHIGFESQETVDRESNGNFYHHWK